MGAGHGHGRPNEASAGGRHVRRLWISLGVLLAFLAIEVVVGLATSSLALLSDAGHMFTDVLGVGMALAAISAARGAGTSDRRTFGLYRAEVLAALANAVLLCGVAVWVVIEAVRRFVAPPEIPGLPLMLTAAAGLAANVLVFRLLRDGAKESLNLRGAYLEVLADMLGSVGVLLAGAVMLITGWGYADPLVAIAIGVFVVPRAIGLGCQAVRILVQAAPAHVDVKQMRVELAALPGVARRPRRARLDADLRHGGGVGAPVDRRGVRPGHGAVRGAAPAGRRARPAALHGAGRAAGRTHALHRAELVISGRQAITRRNSPTIV